MHRDSGAAEVDDEVLAPASHAMHGPAEERFRWRVERLQRGELQWGRAREGGAGEELVEPLRQGLDLWELGHLANVPSAMMATGARTAAWRPTRAQVEAARGATVPDV